MEPQATPYTPYQALVVDTLSKLKAQGWKAATQQQIAAEMGRTPTPSLRRRLKEAAAEGLVYEYTFYTEKGGLAKAYWFQDQLPLNGVQGYPW